MLLLTKLQLIQEKQKKIIFSLVLREKTLMETNLLIKLLKMEPQFQLTKIKKKIN